MASSATLGLPGLGWRRGESLTRGSEGKLVLARFVNSSLGCTQLAPDQPVQLRGVGEHEILDPLSACLCVIPARAELQPVMHAAGALAGQAKLVQQALAGRCAHPGAPVLGSAQLPVEQLALPTGKDQDLHAHWVLAALALPECPKLSRPPIAAQPQCDGSSRRGARRRCARRSIARLRVRGCRAKSHEGSER